MDTFLAVLGIVVSLVLFLIGYRQTVGAKKERIAACNAEVEKILLRRIVLEGYTPARLDVERLMDGKARDFRVSSDDLLSVGQVLNTLYTRIVESDLIPAEERKAMVERITPSLSESESKPVEEVALSTAETRRLEATKSVALAAMAVLASLVGALTTALPELANFDTTQPGMFRTFAATAFASLGVIAFFLVTYRLRNAQEDARTKGSEVEQYLRFEGVVAASLKKSGFLVRPVPEGRAGDFLVERRGRKSLIEVKSWPRRVPARMLSELADRLRRTAVELGADEIIVVTQAPLVETAEALQIPGVTFLTQRQLQSFFDQPKDRPDAA
ncbi:MAG: hypothetical protein LC097_04315 [Burkholderiales bacterium]|nr:hypothetical protein [Burkholderiales bacterium]